MRIRQLPQAVANQIAAGEVIERPASVVKELLENSLDAGANEIHIEINYGGLNQIKISDNGSGIIAEDLPLAIAAHATSKISKLDDLYAINSMGFRGEALASIASIAKVSICSRPEQQEHAMILKAQGTDFTINPSARSLGTTVDVCDIFYNAPVRKRFLKSEKIEFQTLELVVKRFALSAMHTSITLKHNGKLVLTLPAATNEKAKIMRISKIFGSAFLRDAVYLDVEHAGMRLCGYLSGPEYQRSQNDRMWFYINQRMVKDKLINHALKQAYANVLHPGRFPACLLYFSINSKEVDVNVHPTKHEVRFTQTRLVHDFITSSLAKALQKLETKTVEEPTIAYQALDLLPRENISYEQQRVEWVFLNKTYALTFINQQAHIVDVATLYQQYLNHQLQQASKPLVSRPLLVPIKQSVSAEITDKLHYLKPKLKQLGIEFDIMDHQLIIRTIPIQTPHLDLTMLLQRISSTDIDSDQDLLAILAKSQALDFQYLARDEREELEHYLRPDTSYCKPITEDDCKVLLHV